MMAGWTFLLGILVSLQVAQDGVHSCTLRSHKAPGLQPACSTSGAADPTPAIPRRTPASCATHGLQYPDALNKIPSISPVSFKSSISNPVPAAALPPVPVPHYSSPVSASTSGNDRILIDLLLEYFAKLGPPRRLPLPPLGSSSRGFTPASLPVPLTPTPYPATSNPQIGTAELQQLLLLLLSVSGPGSDLLNPAVPSDRLLPSLSPAPPALVTTPPPAVVTVSENAILQAAAASAATTEAPAKAAANESNSTYVPETAAPSAPPSSYPATDPVDSVLANDAVQTSSDPGSASVPSPAPINASDSTFVAPEASGSALEANSAPVSNTAPAADPVHSSTSDVVSSAPPPSGITTPSIA
ncbi:hypothetical protein ACI65C_003952 [Semiaphis heraclei]